ncbi:Mpv17/PMP22 family protein ASCRUDRAFT_68316 [Ascoidea rubescens DSM 1968]|uniref:Protein SYM1 n=1 Tax=Ascoidea rubescens DSM 1968 TaxID=1344418 RepID=A0A1D2VRT6_9ASCO|nr:hypothetical protein ASCRUDRAFT_68316 [Ascoidea rubescens DSM 1968]ODV64324.1 hypothetical protein ASCRUDRAFT_68316 [Ascoidea rubescens DSM 1968]
MSRFFLAYSNSLKNHPLITNGLTTGFLFGSGDVLAQFLFPLEDSTISQDTSELLNNPSLIDSIIPNKTNKQNNSRASWLLHYDIKRTIRAIIYGSLIFSVIGDKWYKILPKINFPFFKNSIYFINNPNFKSNLDTLARVTCDQLLFAPLGIPLYYSAMSLLENKSFNDLKENLLNNYKVTLLTNWAVWPFFQFLNFSLVPVQHRLLTVNIVSILWNCFLSYRNNTSSKLINRNPTYSPPLPE